MSDLEEPNRRRVALAAVAVAVAVVVGLLVVGLTRGSGPSSTALARTDRVVLVAVPGLRWQDLEAIPTQHVAPLLTGSALLSVRSIGPETSALEGYLALGAGNRLEVDPTSDLGSSTDLCLDDLAAAATDEADDGLNGAEPGALGTALHAAGRSTAVFGSSAAMAALMDSGGCVDARGLSTDATFDADVTLIELTGLGDPSLTAAYRAARLRSIDSTIGDLALPDQATVVLFAPAAAGDQDEVLVAGVRDVSGEVAAAPGRTASLVSPSTRRAGYVQLTDLGPTVLSVSGIDEPSAMSGTVISAAATGSTSVSDRTSKLADLAERVEFRDRAVGPVSVVLVVMLVLCGVAGLARRARVARMLAPIVAVYPTLTFLMGLVEYHQLPLDFVVVAVPVLSAFIAAMVVASTSRWGSWAPVTILIAALWLTLVVDIVTGGSLQINTPLGYSPTVAGRFQGFGNLAFGLLGGSAVVVAVSALKWLPALTARTGVSFSVVTWAAFIGAVTIVVDAAPAFGSDVGGTLALVPAFAALLTVLSGRRVRAGRAALVVVTTVAVVAVMAVIDRARPTSSRTHLGRFLDELLDGDGGLIIRRKLHANTAILTSSFWTILLAVLVVFAAGVAWRRRRALIAALDGHQMVHPFVTGFGLVALLGFALNDSGLAVPAVMCDVAVPWLVAVMVPVVKRAGR